MLTEVIADLFAGRRGYRAIQALPGIGLCVPEAPAVSCDLRVLVDDTADQIAPAGSERVEVSDDVG
jgi:hypothetical protein